MQADLTISLQSSSSRSVSDSKRKQLEFGQTNTSKNPAGITYKQNSYGFNLKFYDDGTTRMVKTPWYDEEIPFVEAAEIGTEKEQRAVE